MSLFSIVQIWGLRFEFFCCSFWLIFSPWIRNHGSAYFCGSGSRKPKSCGFYGSGSLALFKDMREIAIFSQKFSYFLQFSGKKLKQIPSLLKIQNIWGKNLFFKKNLIHCRYVLSAVQIKKCLLHFLNIEKLSLSFI